MPFGVFSSWPGIPPPELSEGGCIPCVLSESELEPDPGDESSEGRDCPLSLVPLVEGGEELSLCDVVPEG